VCFLRQYGACAHALFFAHFLLVQRAGDALSLQGSLDVQSKTHRQAIRADEYLPVPSKLEKRFYEVMVVLWAFDRIRGSRIERFPANEDHTSQELRRSFVDSLAYACDSQKGGKTTSAALLQQLPQGVVVWLAGNRGVKQTTVTDLTELLSEALRNIRSHKPFDREVTLARLVHMNGPRLKTYIRFVRGNIDGCIKILQDSSAGKAAQSVPHANHLILAIISNQRLIPHSTTLLRLFNGSNSSSIC